MKDKENEKQNNDIDNKIIKKEDNKNEKINNDMNENKDKEINLNEK